MAVFAATNTFVSGALITASGHNTNWSDVTTWLNNRYNGTDTWLNMKVSATASNPVDITGSGSTTEVSINNTATDGDPLLTFKLSGSQVYVIGVDDSDSDALKFATTGITTNVAMQIPTTGAQVQFSNSASIAVPAISFFGDVDTGFRVAGSNVIGVIGGGSEICEFAVADITPGTNNTTALGSSALGWTRIFMMDGTVASPSYTFRDDTDCGFYRSATNTVDVVCGGVNAIECDNSATANNTRLLVHDVTAGTLRRVTIGANDSGGAGFRVLRIPN